MPQRGEPPHITPLGEARIRRLVYNDSTSDEGLALLEEGKRPTRTSKLLPFPEGGAAVSVTVHRVFEDRGYTV